jgi:hypothetical protein
MRVPIAEDDPAGLALPEAVLVDAGHAVGLARTGWPGVPWAPTRRSCC